MSKDLHIYTNGLDPFVFVLGDVTVHIHVGLPQPQELQPDQSTGTGTTKETVLEHPVRTVLTPPIGEAVISADEFGGDAFALAKRLDDLAAASDSDQVEVVIDTGDTRQASDSVDPLIAGLRQTESDVAIHLPQGRGRLG